MEELTFLEETLLVTAGSIIPYILFDYLEKKSYKILKRRKKE